MAFFEGSSNFTINGGTFSLVAGNQHNNHGLGTGSDLVRLVDPSEGQSSVLDQTLQYHKLMTANIRLRRKIADTPVKRYDAEGRKRGWGNLDARRIIHAATIHGENKDEEFLYVQYKGPDASRAYQQDFQAFSTIRDSISLELFGYVNYNTLPALVFYDVLVPVSHVLERNGFSCMLYTYFCNKALVQGLAKGMSLQNLWVDPRTGLLRTGMFVKHSSNVNYAVRTGTDLVPSNSDQPALNLQTYNNTSTLFQYLTGILPVRNIIEGIRLSNRLSPEWPNNEDAKLILSSLPGTIYHRTTQEVIACYPGDKDQWYYYPWKEQFHVPDAMRENTLVMDDKSVRFMLTPADIANVKLFRLYYDLQPGWWNSFVDSWVSQAHGIFSQLGIEEGEWGKYSILQDFYLQFKCEWDKGSHTPTNTPINTLIYLFIRPVPHPSNDKNEWDDWLGGRSYYWSYNSTGKGEMSEDEWQRLGLPSFRTDIRVWHDWWDHDAHNAIEMVNRHQGFDPLSLDLAQSLGHTILEVVGRNTRFEEVEDEDDEPLAINTSNESTQPSTLPMEFKERMQWIRTYHSLFLGHARTSSSQDSLCPESPDIADVD